MTNRPNRSNSYTAFVTNECGAGEQVVWYDDNCNTRRRFTSIRRAADCARAKYGSGWEVSIQDQNGDSVYVFTIR